MELKMLLIFLFQIYFSAAYKKALPYSMTSPSKARYDNPNYIRDRHRGEKNGKPESNSWARFYKATSYKFTDNLEKPLWAPVEFTERPFNPAWMDYCNPYHCNYNHKIGCGLNRESNRFKWFQSECHIRLHNMCSTFRGQLQYDTVNTSACHLYIMNLREGCPVACEQDLEPVCGSSVVDNHVVLFQNPCSLDAANCRSGTVQEYDQVDMKICLYYLPSEKA